MPSLVPLFSMVMLLLWKDLNRYSTGKGLWGRVEDGDCDLLGLFTKAEDRKYLLQPAGMRWLWVIVSKSQGLAKRTKPENVWAPPQFDFLNLGRFSSCCPGGGVDPWRWTDSGRGIHLWWTGSLCTWKCGAGGYSVLPGHVGILQVGLWILSPLLNLHWSLFLK